MRPGRGRNDRDQRATHDLRKRERHARAVLRAFRDGLAVFDGDGRVVEVNERICEMLRFRADDLLGSAPPLPVWPKHNLQPYFEAFGRAMEEREGRFELPLYRSDGTSFPAVIDVSGLTDEDGSTLPGFLCVVRDVSAEVHEREWLRDAHEIVKLTSWEWDPNDPDRPLTAGFVGFAPLDVVENVTIHDVLSAVRSPYDEQLLDALRRTARDGSPASLEYPLATAEGDTWVDTQLRPVRDSSGAIVRVRGATQDVTSRKLAELQSARVQERLRRAQRMANLGDFEIDPFAGSVTWSPELYRLFDLDPGSFSNRLRDIRALVPPEDLARLREIGVKTVADGEPRQIEHRYLRGGETRWAETRIELSTFDGERRGVRGTMQDITDRKRAELDAHLRANLLDTVDVAVVALDGQRRVMHWNAGAERLYGWSRDEAFGRPVSDFASCGEGDGLPEEVMRILTERGRHELETEVARKDGRVVPVYLRASVFTDPDGNPAGIVGVGVDISERVENERRLRAARDYLRKVTDSMGEGLFTIDSDGHLIYLNRAAEELLGWRQDELAGKHMHEALHFRHRDGSHHSKEDCRLLAAGGSGQVVHVEDDILVRKDGTELPVEMTAAPFETEDGHRGTVVVFSDISDRKRDELRMREQLESLSWVGRIRDALTADRFVVHAQPIVDLRTGATVQHELLIRMHGPGGELIPPGRFLPSAEEYGLVTEIDRWVIARAAELAGAGWPAELNLSASSIGSPGLIDHFKRELERNDADPSLLVVELTETALIQDEVAAELFIERIEALGCKLALDDFGTGYGGFSYLKRLPVDYLKIDREFVLDLPRDDASQHVVKAVVSLARGFGQQTVAEGVEDEETRELLRQLGVDYAQGFAIARPRPVEEALAVGPSAR